MKKMMIAVFALVTLQATAQKFRIGANAGLLASNHEITSGSAKAKLGLSFGLVTDYSFSKTLSFQSGIGFNSRGRRFAHQGHFDNFAISTLEIPLSIVYKKKYGPGTVYFGGGPNLGFNLSAREKGHDEPAEEIKIGSEPDELNMFDLGVGFIFGYEFKSKLFIQMNSNLGLSNLSNAPNFSQRTRLFGLSVGYFFGK